MRGERVPHWLYRIVPTRPEMVGAPTEREKELAAAHFQYLVDLRDRGILIIAGRTQEEVGSFGIAVFEAANQGEAERITLADPAVTGGVFAATVHPYRVAVARTDLVEDA